MGRQQEIYNSFYNNFMSSMGMGGMPGMGMGMGMGGIGMGMGGFGMVSIDRRKLCKVHLQKCSGRKRWCPRDGRTR